MNDAEFMKQRVKGHTEEDAYWLSHINAEAVDLLNEVIEQTGCEVVLSSTWRLGQPFKTVERYLKKKGFVGTICDATPHFPDKSRGEEIEDWLEGHPKTTSFAIVDDRLDMAHLHTFLVRTYWAHRPETYPKGPLGMSQKTVKELVRILGRKE